MAKPIHLEGTTLEGGGQLLRIAVGLSSLTRIPINVTNIRGKRSGGGGLKAQHLTSVQWLGQSTNARISGAGLKSKEITFTPALMEKTKVGRELGERGGAGKANANGDDVVEYEIRQSTPGSVNLVFQAILPYLLFGNERGKVKVKITGGTNVSNSPSVDYVQQVLIPMLANIGIPIIDSDIHSRGWSQGGTKLGSVSYTVTPLSHGLPAFQLTQRGQIKSVRATIIAPKDTESQFRDELDVVFDRRHDEIFGNRDPDVEVGFEDSKHEKRFYLLLVATTTTGMTLGRDWLYDQGVRAGKVDTVVSALVKKVVADLVTEIGHGGCVDEYLRDQLVVFQALVEGKSRVDGGRVDSRKKRRGELVEPSLHAKTAQWVVGEMLGVNFDDDGSCEGARYMPGEGIGDREGGEKDLAESLEKLEIGQIKK